MSQKKILFFILIGILIIALIIGFTYISKKWAANTNAPKSLKIWITEWTSDSYADLIEGFKKYAPDYKKTEIIVEKQSSDADRYRTFLLSSISEGNGPDMFMIRSGEDILLESKIASIPSDVINISDFNKKYDDIFSNLIISSGSKSEKTMSLLGAPIAYETLGVFYNKSLVREVPKTWNALEMLYKDFPTDKYVSNIGLSSLYTPNMLDILPIWLVENGSESIASIGDAQEWVRSYMGYADIQSGTDNTEAHTNTLSPTLSSKKQDMMQAKETTLDLFMRGDIGMVIGYPSLVIDLEKSAKRIGTNNISNIVLTDRLPQFSSSKTSNIGRYTYLGMSKKTQNPLASAKFIEYLMTPEAQRALIKIYPYMIPAQVEFYSATESASLSDTLERTKLGSFMPTIGQSMTVYEYGIKSRIDTPLREAIESGNTQMIGTNLGKIQKNIACEVSSALWSPDQQKDCESQ